MQVAEQRAGPWGLAAAPAVRWGMDYTGSPRAPRGGGRALPLTALSAVLGEDFYSHPEEHGFGECDEETMEQLRRVRQDPLARVRIYRALPPGLGQINRGDWVTLSRDYARQHAMRDDVAARDWPIVQAEVSARNVFTDGRDLDEYGYDGPSLARLLDQGPQADPGLSARAAGRKTGPTGADGPRPRPPGPDT